MEYVKIEGQFPKFSHCAVTLGKLRWNPSWSQETDSDDPEQKKTNMENWQWSWRLFPTDRRSLLQKNVVYFWKKWAWTTVGMSSE